MHRDRYDQTVQFVRNPVHRLVATGAALLFAAYWLIFFLTTDDSAMQATTSALYNTVPAIGLAIVAHVLLDRYVWPARGWVRLAAQVPLAVTFALAWYLAILVVRELREGWLENGFAIRPFSPIAFAWQMFQGVTFYAVAALASFAIDLHRRLAAAQARGPTAEEASRNRSDTILVRTQDETQAVPVAEIVRVSGAGDYSELVLANRTILSNATLARFESDLPQDQFVRAHRSHLVRLGAIVRSEPAGNGRTTLHLSDGSNVVTSRAGSRLLREATF